MKVDHDIPDRVCAVLPRMTVADLKNAIHKENVLSMHFLNLWMNEKTTRVGTRNRGIDFMNY